MKNVNSLLVILAAALLGGCGQNRGETQKSTEPVVTISNFRSTTWTGKFENYEVELLFEQAQTARVSFYSETESCFATAAGKYSVDAQAIILQNTETAEIKSAEANESNCDLILQTFAKSGIIQIVDVDHLNIRFPRKPNEEIVINLTTLYPRSQFKPASTPVATPQPLQTPAATPVPTPAPTPIRNTLTIDPELVNCNDDASPLTLDTRAFSGYWREIFTSKAQRAASSLDADKCESVRRNAKNANQLVTIDLALGSAYDAAMADPWLDDRFFHAVDGEPCNPDLKATAEIRNVVTVNPESLELLGCTDELYSATITSDAITRNRAIFRTSVPVSPFHEGVDFVKCWSMIKLAKRLNKPLAIDMGFAKRKESEGGNPWTDDAFVRVVGLPTCPAQR